MNLDDLQNAWKAEGGDGDALPSLHAELKKARQPIDRIRKNMKGEMFYQLAAILILGGLPFYFRFTTQLSMVYYSAYVLLLLISVYYFNRFYRFFKEIDSYTGNSKDNLYELYYSIRLNMEAYKSFSFLLLPFAILAALLTSLNVPEPGNYAVPKVDNQHWVTLPIVIAVVSITVFLATNWWVEHFYGKYARQIRHLLDELKEN